MPPLGWRKPIVLCSIAGCGHRVRARGWCATHWGRWRLTGDPGPAARTRRMGGFWGKVDVRPDGCWHWIGATNHGYGRFRRQQAHRWAWEQVNGTIPEGLTIDHLCRNTGCVNPDHLEAVTIGENLLRSPIQITTINRRKDRCLRGHPFTEANTKVNVYGRRVCIACRRARERGWI